MGDVTPKQIAATLGISAKTLRAWLRSERAAGHPVLDCHQHGASWLFAHPDAEQLTAEYRASKGRARALGQPHRSASVTAAATASCPTPSGSSSPGRQTGHATTSPRAASGDVPKLPTAFMRTALTAAGFEGWATWRRLRLTDYAEIPSVPGVYVILRTTAAQPIWRTPGTGGGFKGEDPNVPESRLEAGWVPGARTIYIGKADLRKSGSAKDGLRKRLSEYGRFGAGEPVGHRGGRLIWQLADADRLLVAWHPITWTESARAYEQRLLRRFIEIHGRRPFANLTG